MTALALATVPAPARASVSPAPVDVLAVLEGADPGAGVEAVHAMWPGGPRSAAVARIRAAVRDPAVRDSPVARRWARLLRVADRRLPPPRTPIPSRLAYDRRDGWHETDPDAVDAHVDHATETFYGDHT